MDATIDLSVLASYADLVESGHADIDLPADQRVEVVAVLRRAMDRALSYGSGPEISREVAKVHLLASSGEIAATSYVRALDIIRNI